jgi:hypothetical protein
MVHMRLEFEFVDRIERLRSKLCNQIDLDLRLLLPRRFRSPVSLPKRKIAIANEPFEGDASVLKDPAVAYLTSLLRDLISKSSMCCAFRLRFRAESNGNYIDSDVFGFRINDRLAVVPIPPESADRQEGPTRAIVCKDGLEQ